MIKRGFASFSLAVALLIARSAGAQPQFVAQSDSPQWLKDRRYNEGIGIRTGNLELHPGIAGEFGYDSNFYLRSTRQGVDNGPPSTPVIPALEFRVTPSLYLSTLGPERRDVPPSVSFRAGINATYWELIGISSDPVAKSPVNDISRDRNISGAADARLDILSEQPLGGAVFANVTRAAQPDPNNAAPNLSFDRDSISGGAEFVVQPGSGTLDWHFGYQFTDVIFEQQNVFSNTTHQISLRGRWKFRPRTALVYDGTMQFLDYTDDLRARREYGLISSTPLRARLGLNGLITDRFAATVMAGYGASFYDRGANPPQYDSVIGQAELKWFLAASPGIANATDLGLALSSIAVGYTRDFQNSYLGTFYGSDRGYLKFYYFFAGRALATLEGGVGAVEYPRIQNYAGVNGGAIPTEDRHNSFTDVRADATLFSEYRFTDSFGLNGTVRYTQNISNVLMPQSGNPQSACTNTPGSCFDMGWKRVEAYVGVRWFM